MKHRSREFAVSVAEAQIAIVGAACRLPGAANEAAFERLLTEGASAVSAGPVGRWATERFFHPRLTEPGFSYSFAGGYLEAPFDFDPTVFGMSPREAQQVDPQQRLLLEVVFEALEAARTAAQDMIRTARKEIDEDAIVARQQIEGATAQLSEQILRAVLPAASLPEARR